MPTYVCSVRPGLLDESAKAEIARAITRNHHEATGAPAYFVQVVIEEKYLCNLEPTDMVEYGHVLPLPGKEKEWFDALPPELQDYLAALGTKKDRFVL